MAPVDNSPPVKSEGNFNLVCSSKANSLIPVHKYKSSLTGLTVVVAEVDGPVVNGYFCLATEAHDDDGLPHTLEHLIFLGSEQYPYKGVLDLVANRCLASGTNAWTDTDHTCYTMTTAGSEGFLSLIPIYLDHVLYPTLTDSGYVTEVHHVTGDGEDAGVVYCEMQGRENSCDSRVQVELLRAMYPGRCGYKSETGGIMKNLRESTNNEKVRAYHKQFYRPENLCLIITGQVKPEDVFKALEPFEQKIVSKGSRGEYVRPWQDPVPPLVESRDIEVKFPCDEEDNGTVYLAWRGPSAVTEQYKFHACSVLLKYLSDTSISPLPKEFVEIPDPYCSKVSYNLIENSVSTLILQFESVPLNKLSEVKPHLFKVLDDIVNGKEPIEMKRLSTVINRQRLESLSHLENNPHDSIAFMVIGDHLYSNRTKQDMDQRLNLVTELEKMQGEELSWWVGLVREYLVEGASVAVRGVPSVETRKQMADEEQERLEKQRSALGADGLKEKEESLAKAIQQNEIPPPNSMLTSVKIPSTESIQFHKIESYTTNSRESHPKFDVSKVPVYIHVDHIQSNFVYLSVLMDTTDVSLALRPYLPLLLESLLECPVRRGEVLVPYEEVVAQLEVDTIHAGLRLGVESGSRFQCGPFSQTCSLFLQLEPNKYEKGISWIRELLYQTELTAERLKIIAAKMVNDVAQTKRDGNTMARALMKGLIYNKESNHGSANVLRQHKFLTRVLERLNSAEECGQVLAEVDSVRQILSHPGNLALHLATNLDLLATKHPDPASCWTELLPPTKQSVKNKLRVISDWEMLESVSAKVKNVVVGIGAVESTFFYQTVPAIKNFLDPDLAPLLVFLQYLTQLEGPMWRLIRGIGLAYSYNMLPRPNEGLLYLTFYKATNLVGAYKKTKAILEEKLSEDGVWDQALFESAKSSVIFEVIERERSIGDVVIQSLLSYFKHVPQDYNRWLVTMISKVTVEDLSRVGPKYIKRLFDPSQARCSVVCHPSKVEEVKTGFSEFGVELKAYSSLEESFLNEV